MNIQEAHRQFKLFLDKVSSEVAPELTHKQIDVYIHEAEVRIIKQAYGQNNIYKKGYQEIQKRTDDLNTLVKTGYIKALTEEELLASNKSFEQGIYVFPLDSICTKPDFDTPFDEPYMFFVKGMVKVESTKVTTPVYTGISLIPQDKYTEVISDPFNKSRISSPVAIFEDNSIKIDTNGGDFIPSIFRITFIKYPRMVVWNSVLADCVNSELPEQKQREVIQLAVALCLEGLESQRTQGNIQLLSTQE